MRWEEPHHSGPGLQLDRHPNPLPPTLQHDPPLQPRLHPLARGSLPPVPESEGAQPPDENAVAADPTPGAGGTPPSGDPAAAVPAPTAPSDADDLRGFHFKRLMAKPLTNALVFGLAAVIGVALTIAVSPLLGAIAFVVAAIAGVVVVFLIADNQAADAFFSSYAADNGLELGGKAQLPPSTPLLRKGDERYAKRTLSGPFAPDCEGILALYTYVDEYRDSDGNEQKNYYNYTVGLSAVPECAAHVPQLYCQRKSGLRALEKVEDAFRGKKVRLKLESEALDRHYEIFAVEGEDQVWLRRLFSPVFIVWLTESAPAKFAFELVDGNLCCYIGHHKEDAADLDAMRTATADVARRLREESAQTSPGA